MDANLRKAALEYHEHGRPGKISVTPTKQLTNQRDLALAYSPGVAAACEEIVADPANVFRYTARGNLVGVITNGTAVLGLGNIGALASKPVMEGKAVLFKKFAGLDVFDIEINETDPDKLVEIIAGLEATFGGINLEDIKAPECFTVERKLRERMKIPVFHDDQHGTAITVSAAFINGLKVVGKDIKKVKVVTSGAGAAALACLDLMVDLGLPLENIWVTDIEGVVYEGRVELMDPDKARFAQKTDARKLAEVIQDADVFLGLSAGGVLKPEMVAAMGTRPLILALANPTPEILPEVAHGVRDDVVMATGRSDYPNQVNNVLCFPYMFRGALDCGASTITREMEIAVVHAIAHAHQQLHAGDGRSAGAEANDLGVFQGLASDFQGVDHAGRGDDGGAVLVIVEHGNVALLDQGAFDLEALGRLDVFQVDATEGDRDALDGVDEGLRAFRVHFDVEDVDAGETLEQNALAFHDRLGSQWAEVAQAQDGGAVGDDRYQVALAGVLVGQFGIATDFANGLGHAWAVGQRQITGGGSGLGEFDAQFAWAWMGMVLESGSFQI